MTEPKKFKVEIISKQKIREAVNTEKICIKLKEVMKQFGGMPKRGVIFCKQHPGTGLHVVVDPETPGPILFCAECQKPVAAFVIQGEVEGTVTVHGDFHGYFLGAHDPDEVEKINEVAKKHHKEHIVEKVNDVFSSVAAGFIKNAMKAGIKVEIHKPKPDRDWELN